MVGVAVGAVGAMVGHASPRAVPSALGWVAWVCADRLSYQFSPHSPVLWVRSLLKRAKHTTHPFQTHASHTARHAFGILLWSRVPMERSGTYRRIDSLVWTVNSLGMVPVRELPASSLWATRTKNPSPRSDLPKTTTAHGVASAWHALVVGGAQLLESFD